MSNYELFESDPNEANPLHAGSSAWANPALRELYEPTHPETGLTPAEAGSSERQLPMWAYLLLVPPILGAMLSTDAATPAIIRLGWFPALMLAALFVAWRLLRRAS